MFKIKIANLNVEINNLYPSTRKFCEGYETTEKHTDIKVSVTEEMVEQEKAASKEEVSKQMCEITSIYRQICSKALAFNTLFIHASCIAYDDKGVLFFALSGTGKSTHSRMWKELYKEHVSYVNDDKPLLRYIDDKWYACGTPWNGKHRLGENKIVPLKAICLLERSKENYCDEITANEIIRKIFNQIIIPTSEASLDITLHLLSSLLQKTALYKIGCNVSYDAAKTVYEKIKI